jgi:hypothetical protein
MLHKFSIPLATNFTASTRQTCIAHTCLLIGLSLRRWWINGLFAFRDGIIDDKCTDGGICYNELGAFAVVLKDADEENSPSPDKFTYKCRADDRGRFRLTAADFQSRYHVRVLRSNTLSSLWAPRAGIRYDGLFVYLSLRSLLLLTPLQISDPGLDHSSR